MFGWLKKQLRKPEALPEPLTVIEPWQQSPELPVEYMLQLIQRPSVPYWNERWPWWENTRLAHVELMRRYVASLQPYPEDKYKGRGIVIVTGGWKFFFSTYVTVRVLRKVGCTLPIQLWYLGDKGEYTETMGKVMRSLGVEWVDANAYAREHGIACRNLNGWELKAFAGVHSRFDETLSLDADSYPTSNPEYLFDEPEYLKRGAIYWPDTMKPLTAGQWHQFGLPDLKITDGESGQLLVNKRKHWRALNLTWLLNDHSDYSFKHVYGDKSTWIIGPLFVAQVDGKLDRTNLPYAMPPYPPGGDAHGLWQKDFSGRVIFLHRIHDKFYAAAPGEKPSKGDKFISNQRGDRNKFNARWVHERFCFDALAEAEEMVYPDKQFRFRDGTNDRWVWDAADRDNEYRLPDDLPGANVLDIGAHIGAFARACLRRGAGHVYCAEPDRFGPGGGNICLLQRNLKPWRERVRLDYRAAWRSDVPETDIPFAANDHLDNEVINTGAPSAVIQHAPAVKMVAAGAFDEMVANAMDFGGGAIDLCKLDCEGSEWPALSTSRMLPAIKQFCGEYHEWDWDGRRWGEADLIRILGDAGFTVVTVPHDPPNTGFFWATR